MTRINLIPVETLSDQHLLAEYREIPRMASFARKTVKKQQDIPVTFTLNKGHMTFFLDKAEFLEERHAVVTEECLRRGIKLTDPRPFEMFRNPKFRQKSWEPKEEEILVSKERIDEKLAMKPAFYRWSNQ